MISVGWGDIQETYAVMTIREAWSAEAMREHIASYYTMIESKPHPVRCLIDVRYANVPPLNILSVFLWSARNIPANTSTIILVSQNTLWKRLYTIVTNTIGLTGLDLCFVTSMDEAYGLVAATHAG